MIGLLFNRFTLYAALAAMAFAGAYAYRSSLIQRGYDQAMAQMQEEENTKLRELLKENSRLVGVVKGLEDADRKNKQSIASFRARERTATDKLRTQEADHQRALAAANAEALRKYASFLDGHIEECRGMVAEFAGQAAECQSTAKTLIDYIKELP